MFLLFNHKRFCNLLNMKTITAYYNSIFLSFTLLFLSLSITAQLNTPLNWQLNTDYDTWQSVDCLVQTTNNDIAAIGKTQTDGGNINAFFLHLDGKSLPKATHYLPKQETCCWKSHQNQD